MTSLVGSDVVTGIVLDCKAGACAPEAEVFVMLVVAAAGCKLDDVTGCLLSLLSLRTNGLLRETELGVCRAGLGDGVLVEF